jgi:tetratricopeptide (TPR) repeat protein
MREPPPGTVVDADHEPFPPAPTAPPLPPRIIIGLLRAWWALAAFVGAAILGGLLVLPLALTPDHYWDGVQSQFRALLDLASTYPLPTVIAALLVAGLTIAGYLANRRELAAEQRAKDVQTARVVGKQVAHDVDPRFDALDAGHATLIEGQERLAGGQAVGIAVGVATLNTAQQTLSAVTELSGAVGKEIRQLAQATPHAPTSGRTRRVFLSSTSVDLSSYRERVASLVQSLGQFAVTMDAFSLRPELDATGISLSELRSSELYLLLLAWRYGYVPEGQELSVTHQEYREARKLGLPCFVFLADPQTDTDLERYPEAVRDQDHRDQLLAFRAEVEREQLVGYFTTREELADKVAAALHQYLLDHPVDAERLLDLVDMPQHGGFVGREQELDDLLQRLRTGGAVGVFAVEGMGGVGKTALAAEAVEQLANDEAAFPGGVLWVACAGLEGESGLLALLTEVARSVGRADIAALTDLDSLRQALSTALRGRPQTLVALDNVEPGLDADIALQTLHAPGHATLLLTARDQVAPNLVEVIRLPPLPSPEAAELFEQRLRQETGGARPTLEDEAEVTPLVEAVGGLPLAVELLAADAGRQGTALSALRGELDQKGINAAAFSADPKHVVTQVFDRSYLRLPASQQRLFAGLGMLAEVGFPRAAAESLAVVAGQGDASAPAPADAVRSLVRAGLVDPLLGERLRLHPLLRAYAQNKLTGMGQETKDTLGDAMLAYWLDYAEAHPSQDGRDPAGMDAQEAEAAGLMSALEWAHVHHRHRALLDLVYSLGWTWRVRGRRAEERQFRPWTLEAARALDDKNDLWFMTHELALLDNNTGDMAAARAGYEEALRLSRELGDMAAIRVELHSLAVRDAQIGDVAAARAGYEEALRLARELGDKFAIRDEVHGLAALDNNTGNLAAARAGYEEALRLARELGDKVAIRDEVHGLAVLDGNAGNVAAARAGHEEALRLAQELGDKVAIREEVHELALRDDNAGNQREAEAGYRRALELAREVGNPEAEADDLRDLGALLAEGRDPAGGRALMQEAITLFERLNDVGGLERSYRYLARLDRREERRDEAIAHYRRALRYAEQIESPDAESPDAEESREALRDMGAEP